MPGEQIPTNASIIVPTSTNTATNQVANSALLNNVVTMKDSRWLQLEVCREFQRGQCTRSDLECKFAHPPPHIEIQNGRVTACFDSIKGRCTRENPKCKYLHPPQHLKDVLLVNGRNNLVMKNFAKQISAQITTPLSISPMTAVPGTSALYQNITAAPFNPYAAYALNAAAFYPGLISAGPDALGMMSGIVPATQSAATLAAMQKMVSNRNVERVETAAAHALLAPNSSYMVTSSLGKKRPLEMDTITATTNAANQHTAESLLLAAAALNSPVNKRAALDKGGVPMIQPIYQTVPSLGMGMGMGMGSTAAFPYSHLTFPGLTASYVVPAASLAGNPTSFARF